MITKEKTKEFIDRAYATACKHGFHDEKRSVMHFLMLVVTEVSEAVEADRKTRHADLSRFKREYEKYPNLVDEQTRFVTSFEKYVKDTLCDEFADVCIRLYDLCGELGTEPSYYDYDAKKDEFSGLPYESFSERCFFLCTLLTNTFDDIRDVIGSSLQFVYCMCDDMGVDLERHIELKMRYNESREVRHGKQY